LVTFQVITRVGRRTKGSAAWSFSLTRNSTRRAKQTRVAG